MKRAIAAVLAGALAAGGAQAGECDLAARDAYVMAIQRDLGEPIDLYEPRDFAALHLTGRNARHLELTINLHNSMANEISFGAMSPEAARVYGYRRCMAEVIAPMLRDRQTAH